MTENLVNYFDETHINETYKKIGKSIQIQI